MFPRLWLVAPRLLFNISYRPGCSFSPAAAVTMVYEPKMYTSLDDDKHQGMIVARNWTELGAVKLGSMFRTPGRVDFQAHHGPPFITEVLPWLEGRFTLARSRVVA